jgi:hypothetical protein
MSSLYDPADSIEDNIVSLSDGNPGAVTVLTQIVQNDPDPREIFNTLDDMNIYGSRIWLGYKDYCGEDIGNFIDCVVAQEEDMVELINERKHGGKEVVTVN